MNSADLAEAVRRVFGDHVPVYNADGARVASSSLKYCPGRSLIKELQRDSSKADAFLYGTEVGEEARIVRCNLLKERGDNLFKARLFEKARLEYLGAIAAIVGKDFEIPLPTKQGGVLSDVYMNLTVWERVDLMACCNAIAQCMVGLKNVEEALEWLVEVDVIDKSMFLSSPRPTFEWFSANVNIQEHYVQRITAYARTSDIYLELGNTGNAVHKTWIGATNMQETPTDIDTSSLRCLITSEKVRELTQLRHPDPGLVARLELQNEELQIRGSWKKVNLKKSGGMTPRMGFASFVWNSFYYVAGGERSLDGPYYRDFWRLDLNKLDQWQALPSYPVSESVNGHFTGWSMVVHNNRAYLFTGRSRIDFFDLITETWGSFATTFKRNDGLSGSDPWPFPNDMLRDYAIQMMDGKLYVFGGSNDKAALGSNLFIVLDIEKRQWEKLSGTVEPKADNKCPGPRHCATSWVDEFDGRMMLMYGEADRQSAKIAGQPNAGYNGYGYDDLWSWNVRDRKWRRERLVGNPPCPRSEMSHTYNSKLNQLVVFGGYSPTIPTHYKEKNETFSYSYYADTFIYDATASPPRWKQVLTRGFPTYRAQAQLVSDPFTGKTFLFGGYTNTEFVPSRKHYISRTFSDLWQLCVDKSGGFFEGVDLEEEARTARAGPWQRCFSCGCAGPWKKCGGSCGGRAFFCDPWCLKEGWKEHKQRHKCTKKAG